MKDHSNGYYAKVVELITKIEEEQYDNIRAAGQLMAEAIKNDRLIHVYGGGGHTTLPVGEMFFRAGGLCNINPCMETGLSVFNQAQKYLALERCVNYGRAIMDYYNLQEGDLLIIYHNIGTNPATIDAALEAKENNIGVWLAPAIYIHRSPLCGRNFEYWSEDPLVAGRCAGALVHGVQSQKIGTSLKHFCCNNKETNRKNSDSRVSERALREIYLKGFELIVKHEQPYTIMTSYNKMNGIHTSENQELLTGILRGEWGFQGMVTTDWWTNGEHYLEAKAGNDLKMGAGFPERVREAYDRGLISKEEITADARRILATILKFD